MVVVLVVVVGAVVLVAVAAVVIAVALVPSGSASELTEEEARVDGKEAFVKAGFLSKQDSRPSSHKKCFRFLQNHHTCVLICVHVHLHGRFVWAFCEPTYHLHQVRRLADGNFQFNF